MPVFITIRGEVQSKGNHCRVTRANGDVLGVFSPNEMSIFKDNPYDPIAYRTVFPPEGASLKDWRKFQLSMKLMNGRAVFDNHMPGFIREEASFLTVE